MKKYLFVILTLSILACSAPSLKAQSTEIDPYSLPRVSQTFLRKNFIYAFPLSVTKDKKGYEVVMNDNSTIDLDSRGNWTTINCTDGVPETVVPQPIRIYISKRFSSKTITRISRSKQGYVVELSEGMRLHFDPKYKLTLVD